MKEFFSLCLNFFDVLSLFLKILKKIMQNEQILGSHPIFRYFPNLIFVAENVDKINRHNVPQNRLFVLHISGIFLLENKTFQRNYSVSRIIPTYSIEKLTVSNEFVYISGNGTEIKFTSQNQIKIAAYVYGVRFILFGYENSKLNFEMAPELNDFFDSQILNYLPKHPIADRFLGMVLLSKSNSSEELIRNTYNLLCNENSYFTFTKAITNGIFFYEIATSISLGTEVKEVIFEDIDLGECIPHLKQIIRNSKSIKKLTFRNSRIQSHFQDFKQLFDQKDSIKIEELCYEKCRFLSQECSIFFDSFSGLQSHIKILKVIGCMLIRSTLDSIFQSLFFSNCFHSLETLIISDVSLNEDLSSCIFQLLCCGWVLQEKKLKTLSLRNCNLDIGNLFANLNELDCGIDTLDLGYNKFTELPSTLNLHNLNSLILDHCSFTGDSLLQFFKLLANEKETINLNIDLSRLIADEDCFDTFYMNCSKIKIQSLVGLVWDGNTIKASQIGNFVSFLKKQINLSILSISYCIPRSEQQKSLPFLIDLVRHKSFEQFCIASTKEESFGSPLVSVLETLFKKSHIRNLDITNQAISDIGLYLILREIGPSLEELWFDGYCPTSVETFLNIGSKILEHPQLKVVSWPGSDVNSILSKIHLEQRARVVQKINELKSDFVKRFGDVATTTDEEELMKTRIDTTFRAKDKSTTAALILPSVINKYKLKDILQDEECYQMYDNETLQLFKECEDVLGTHPIKTTQENIEEKTSLAFLTSQLVKHYNQ